MRPSAGRSQSRRRNMGSPPMGTDYFDESFGGTGPSIHNDSHHLDADPQRVEFMALALAQMVVQVTARLVVEADPQLFLVLGQLDLERFARRQALRRSR